MVIFVTVSFLFLFYLCAVPVQFAVTIRLAERNGFGTGTAPFERRFAKRSAYLRASGQKKRLPWRRFRLDLEKSAYIGVMMKTSRYALRHIRFEGLEVRGTVASADAANTALICGCLEAAKCALAPLDSAGRIDISVNADFSSIYSHLELSGMISMRVGHIMGSALIFAANIIKRRFIAWKSTRLKIS